MLQESTGVSTVIRFCLCPELNTVIKLLATRVMPPQYTLIFVFKFRNISEQKECGWMGPAHTTKSTGKAMGMLQLCESYAENLCCDSSAMYLNLLHHKHNPHTGYTSHHVIGKSHSHEHTSCKWWRLCQQPQLLKVQKSEKYVQIINGY